MEAQLTEQQKGEMYQEVRQFLADELEIDADEITNDTNIIDDLGADSILFLEMFEEFKEKYGIKIEVRTIGKYMLKNPVYTFGETINAMFEVIEKGEALLDELEEGEAQVAQQSV
jgi:acyl carrier protein